MKISQPLDSDVTGGSVANLVVQRQITHASQNFTYDTKDMKDFMYHVNDQIACGKY